MIDDLEDYAGKLVHDFASLNETLIKFGVRHHEAVDSMFDREIVPSALALMNFICSHQSWREEQRGKLDVNERLCQVRH